MRRASLAFLLISILSLVGCKDSEVQQTANGTDQLQGKVVLGIRKNSKFQLTGNFKEIQNLLSSGLEATHPGVLDHFSKEKNLGPDLSGWHEVELVAFGDSTQYLTGVIEPQDTTTYRIALEVDVDPLTDSVYFSYEKRDLKETHTCKGNGCSSCMFDYTPKGRISGCKCLPSPHNGPNGKCDHTVTTTVVVTTQK